MRARSLPFALAAVAALSASSGVARAEDVSPSGKGIAGGALLGAEGVMLAESAFGVRPWWAYLIGGAVGGGGMAYVGHLAESGSDGKVPMFMLAGGLVLAIPTSVAVLSSTAYHPTDDYTEDQTSVGAPSAEPPRPAAPPAVPGAPSAPRAMHLRQLAPPMLVPTGVVHLRDASALTLAVPAVEVRPTYTAAEVQRFGVEQRSEVRVPLVSATF